MANNEMFWFYKVTMLQCYKLKLPTSPGVFSKNYPGQVESLNFHRGEITLDIGGISTSTQSGRK